MIDSVARALDAFDGTHGEVRDTEELRRVLNLPWSEPLPEGYEEELSQYLGSRGMTLFVSQAEILTYLNERGGCLAQLPVGEGKTLPTYLALSVVDETVALLLVPAKLRWKTYRDFKDLAEQWDRGPSEVRFDDPSIPALKTPGGDGILHVASYTNLSRRPDLISKISPGLIVLDEAHNVKNLQAACTRRLIRWLRSHPTRLLALSGTVTSRSLLDFWHILAATHGYQMPLPTKRSECALWARAVDEKVEVRARPGALRLFLRPGEPPTTEGAREAVGRRWRNTPGVVYRETTGVGASITLRCVAPSVPPGARPVLRALERDGIDPNGEEEARSADIWRHRRTLVLGFAYVWKDPPPEPWRLARRRWNRQLRQVLEMGDPRYDTELQITNAVRRGEMDDRLYRAWEAIRDSASSETEPRWYGDETLDYVIRAAQKRDPSLIWVEHQAFGERLAQLSGWPYYRDGGRDKLGNFIEDHDPDSGHAILSIAANKDGRNLQAWHSNIFTGVMPQGLDWDQALGRTHRRGQKADEVTGLILCTRQGLDLEQALSDARYQRAMTGAPHKLLLADWI